MRYWKRLIAVGVTTAVVVTLTQCAHKEVKHQLDKSVQTRGETYAQELQAQSPFKKVSLSWGEAKELMKERNPKYRKAVATQAEAEKKGSLVKNFTQEVKKSLQNTATNTLNPKELARALNNPIAALPKQLESLTDLKNISHSLEKKEWERVGKAVSAEKLTRAEMVKLKMLFSESQILRKQDTLLKKYEKQAEENPAIVSVLKKKRAHYEKQRSAWLDSVRDFYNAEFYDVEFKGHGKKFTRYRHVANPGFHKWERWGALDHSNELAKHLCSQHDKNKPTVPGMNSLKTKLGVQNFQNNLSLEQLEKQNGELRNEVRTMLKKWRELKKAQSKIAELNANDSATPAPEKLTPKQVEQEFQVYQFLQKELRLVSYFWMLDEDCWS